MLESASGAGVWGCLLPGGGVSALGGCLLWGGVCSWGGGAGGEGCISAPGGLLPGGIPACTETDPLPPREQNDRQV